MTPMRSDARTNRDALLAAAGTLFSEQGPEVALDAIAQRAGVSIATLYRHFPHRGALVTEVFRQEIDRLGEVDHLLDATDDAAGALGLWLERFVDYAGTKRAIGDALHALPDDTRPTARGTVVRAIDTLFAAGRADGSLRDDVDADDLLAMTAGLWSMPDGDDTRTRERMNRLVGVVLDGLRRR